MTVENFREKYWKIAKLYVGQKDPQQMFIHLVNFIALNHGDLPPFFPQSRAENLSRYPQYFPMHNNVILFDNRFYCGIEYLPTTIEKLVDVDTIIGYTWLFQPNFADGRPLPERLASILLGTPDSLPPVPAIQAGTKLDCSDGNHRIYAAYLLGRKVKVGIEGKYCDLFDENKNPIEI